jgi:hypothetical protein
MVKSPEKERKAAIQRARARLEKRVGPGNGLWQIIRQYATGAPDVQTADRSAALVLGAILEQGLELSILSHCVFGWNTPEAEAEQKKLFGAGEDAPMTFAIKTRIAYALGVYGPDTKDDLDTIRHIRNFFAHDKGHLTFDDEDVSGLCKQLKWIERYPWGGVAGEKPASARAQYVETIQYLYAFLATGVGNPVRYRESPFPELWA